MPAQSSEEEVGLKGSGLSGSRPSLLAFPSVWVGAPGGPLYRSGWLGLWPWPGSEQGSSRDASGAVPSSGACSHRSSSGCRAWYQAGGPPSGANTGLAASGSAMQAPRDPCLATTPGSCRNRCIAHQVPLGDGTGLTSAGRPGTVTRWPVPETQKPDPSREGGSGFLFVAQRQGLRREETGHSANSQFLS